MIYGFVLKEVNKMKIIDNINSTVKDELVDSLKKGSKAQIAAACFSMYAYKELKKQFESI